MMESGATTAQVVDHIVRFHALQITAGCSSSSQDGLKNMQVRNDGAQPSSAQMMRCEVGSGGADDVERAGDEDGVVVLGEAHGAVAGLLDRLALDDLVAAERASRGGQVAAPACLAATARCSVSTSVELVGAQGATSISFGSRPFRQPTTRIRRPAGSKSSKNTCAHASAPAGLCAPSMITSG